MGLQHFESLKSTFFKSCPITSTSSFPEISELPGVAVNDSALRISARSVGYSFCQDQDMLHVPPEYRFFLRNCLVKVADGFVSFLLGKA
jgi:formyltetrahydrofolate synthetase